MRVGDQFQTDPLPICGAAARKKKRAGNIPGPMFRLSSLQKLTITARPILLLSSLLFRGFNSDCTVFFKCRPLFGSQPEYLLAP